MERARYEELELLVSEPYRPGSFVVEQTEATAKHLVFTRLNAVLDFNRLAVDAIIDLDDYVEERSKGRHPATIAGMRQLQMTTAYAANLLIGHYMTRGM